MCSRYEASIDADFTAPPSGLSPMLSSCSYCATALLYGCAAGPGAGSGPGPAACATAAAPSADPAPLCFVTVTLGIVMDCASVPRDWNPDVLQFSAMLSARRPGPDGARNSMSNWIWHLT